MRVSLMVRFAAFVLLLLLWTVFAVAAWAEDAAAPGSGGAQQAAPGDGIAGTPQQTDPDALRSFRPPPPAAQAQPAPPPEAAPPKPAAAATSIADCVNENGEFVTHGKKNSFVFTLTNKCEKRLKCTIDAYVTTAKGPASGHGTLIRAPKSRGDSFTMRVKLASGTAEVSRDCKTF